MKTNRYMTEEQRAEIINHVKRWEKSGIPQAEYCRQNNVNIGAFNRYKYKLSIAATQGKTTKPSGFVTVTSSEQVFYDVVIGKATVKVPPTRIAEFLKEVNAND